MLPVCASKVRVVAFSVALISVLMGSPPWIAALALGYNPSARKDARQQFEVRIGKAFQKHLAGRREMSGR